MYLRRWTHRSQPRYLGANASRVNGASVRQARQDAQWLGRVVIDGGKPNTIGITRSVRVPHAELAKQVPTFETCAGTGGPEQRLAEQDQDGIDCEILFSQITFVLRQTKDDDFYRDCIRAYNEFLGEEYMAQRHTGSFAWALCQRPASTTRSKKWNTVPSLDEGCKARSLSERQNLSDA